MDSQYTDVSFWKELVLSVVDEKVRGYGPERS